MFTHCVFFWLKPGLSSDDLQTFVDGLQSLVEIDTVRFGSFGVPAATDRPIIDRTYSYGLVCVFDDEEGQEAYQIDPVHDRFREECGGFWRDVKIYDFTGA